MKGKLLFVSLVLVLVSSLAAMTCAPAAPAPPAEPASTTPTEPTTPTTAPPSTETVTWVFNWGMAPLTTAEAAAFRPGGRFETMLLENSGGRFKLDVKPRLFNPLQVADAIATGKAEIGDVSASYMSGTYPLWDFGALPFRFSSMYDYEKCVNDPEMIAILDKSYRDAGLQYLSSALGGEMNCLFGTKPFPTLDDFKGAKIRTMGLTATNSVECLGAAPVSISGAEMVDALYRGVVDAALATLHFGMAMGLGGVTTDISVWGVMPVIANSLVCNAEAFDALPADLQKVLVDTAKDMSRQLYYAYEPQFGAYRAWIANSGIDYVRPAEGEVLRARALTKPVVDGWLEIAGPYGQEVLDISAKYIQ